MNPYLSRSYFKTFREAPSDAETVSTQLMMRAGLLRKLNPGIFSYTPLMLRCISKVTQAIRSTFDDIQWEECLMPTVIPAELWKETGRWNQFGDQLLKFKDRKNLEYCLGPTHEEVVTDLARYFLTSYKQLPFTLYQIQTKFRDEIRPRFGVMRAREFIMLDGYSFHATTEDLDRHYEEVRQAYCKLFDKLGLKYRMVEADTGAIGGSASHEFHVLADSGEDLLLWCDSCDYAANVERAECVAPNPNAAPNTATEVMQEVSTPYCKSIDDVCKLLNVKPSETLKAVLFENPFTSEFLGVLMRGDREVSTAKVMARTGWAGLEAANPEKVLKNYNVAQGHYSPVSLPKLKWLFDLSVDAQGSYIAGSKTPDTHLKNVVPARDFGLRFETLDLASAKEGETCPRCKKGKYQANRGIEVGHIFKLGNKYSKSMNLNYLDGQSQAQIPTMGCYGIGVTRVIAAAIEQNHDKDGIIFPAPLSPIDATLINLVPLEGAAKSFIESALAFAKQKSLHFSVDDRDLQPGVKFKDADLLGSPWHVIIGKKFASTGNVEFKNRRTGERVDISTEACLERLKEIFS